MTDNTDFKIVDHLAAIPTTQYSFTFPATWKPANENQTGELGLETDAYPFLNLSMVMDYGLKNRPIVLQGPDLDDGDQYLLRNAMENPRIKKLYLGDTYYYYVRGIDSRIIRDEANTTLYNYTASFMAVDPFMYDDTISSAQVSTNVITIPAAGNLAGGVYVEPIFWIDNESGNTLTFTDDRGCRLTFKPPDNDVWVVMPYFNYRVRGFFPDHPIAYKANVHVIADVATVWAQDCSIEAASPEFSRATAGSTFIGVGASLSLTDTTASKVYTSKESLYPRAEYNTATTIAVGGAGGTAIYAQWRKRR